MQGWNKMGAFKLVIATRGHTLMDSLGVEFFITHRQLQLIRKTRTRGEILFTDKSLEKLVIVTLWLGPQSFPSLDAEQAGSMQSPSPSRSESRWVLRASFDLFAACALQHAGCDPWAWDSHISDQPRGECI
jgi:hypothetical protein